MFGKGLRSNWKEPEVILDSLCWKMPHYIDGKDRARCKSLLRDLRHVRRLMQGKCAVLQVTMILTFCPCRRSIEPLLMPLRRGGKEAHDDRRTRQSMFSVAHERVHRPRLPAGRPVACIDHGQEAGGKQRGDTSSGGDTSLSPCSRFRMACSHWRSRESALVLMSNSSSAAPRS